MLGQVLRQKSKLWRQGQILKSFSQDNSPLRLIYTVELGPSLTELDIGGLKNTATGESSWRANSWRGFGNLPGPSEPGLTRTRLSLEGMNAEAWKGLHTSTKVEIEQVSLNNIADNPRRKRKRLGRGIGSGKGKTSGRGHKGQKARTGRQVKAGFEGGQAPAKFYTPKRGFHNPFSLEYVPLNLSKLQHAINQGKLKSDRLITMRDLRNTGIVSRHLRDGIKLLARGKEVFDKKINIQVSQVSAPAREAIEKAGGTVTTVYYTALGLRALVMPEWFTKKGRNLPRPARPHPKKRKYWDAVGSLPPVADTSASRIENLG